ncbi:dna methyltransferase dim-2 [Trichoderma arundinaceum]|uniref:Dna methyltransferase dim-2 n=1 Tax=Trichoderma arundinaceum TaxID=490622 RepID=A0A395NHA7_TRIAR|nr:dna methyltransferase dim-2 [Trichoderma arundinaceum]
MTAAERQFFVSAGDVMDASRQPMAAQPGSRSYGRMFPNKLFDTIVTAQTPSDAKNGRLLHWRESRLITIMEARRAQGLRDEEVLLGDPITQYRIVGNSVAREVAVALGITFREAWVASLRKNKESELTGGYMAQAADSRDLCDAVKLDESTSRSGSSSSNTHTTRDSTPLTSVDGARVSSDASTPSVQLLAGHKRPGSSILVVEIPRSLMEDDAQ